MIEVRTTERSKAAVVAWAETVGLAPVGQRADVGVSIYVQLERITARLKE